MNYSFVRRANKQDRKIFNDIIESANELAPENLDFTDGVLPTYSIERIQSGYYVLKVDFNDGGKVEYASMVRCGKCNEIRDLFDGQIECCLGCDTDWE